MAVAESMVEGVPASADVIEINSLEDATNI
ncbi:hypothetical protein DZE40_004732 [Clostridium beijerinckii]|nr:hypothetical protein [Clostridium beijerinckii]